MFMSSCHGVHEISESVESHPRWSIRSMGKKQFNDINVVESETLGPTHSMIFYVRPAPPPLHRIVWSCNI